MCRNRRSRCKTARGFAHVLVLWQGPWRSWWRWEDCYSGLEHPWVLAPRVVVGVRGGFRILRGGDRCPPELVGVARVGCPCAWGCALGSARFGWRACWCWSWAWPGFRGRERGVLGTGGPECRVGAGMRRFLPWVAAVQRRQGCLGDARSGGGCFLAARALFSLGLGAEGRDGFLALRILPEWGREPWSAPCLSWFAGVGFPFWGRPGVRGLPRRAR